MQTNESVSLVGERVSGVRKIAVLRANALGDFLFILPAVEALRASYPDAQITLLARNWHAAFLKDRPGSIDRVVVIPSIDAEGRMPEPSETSEVRRFIRAMREEHFDLAVQLQGGGRESNPFMKALGARVTIGLKTPDAEPLDRWVPYSLFQHEVLRFLEVVSLVGARTDRYVPHLTVIERDRDEARRVVPQRSQPLVVLHPGASDVRRWWPAEKFAAIGDALAEVGAQVLITGTEQEREQVSAVRQAMHAEGRDLCGQLSLGGLTGLLECVCVVVANDTGPLHLAQAVGTATVSIYWAYNLLMAGPLARARHRPVVSWRMQCPVCGCDNASRRCEHQVSFVSDISIEEVRNAALELFRSE